MEISGINVSPGAMAFSCVLERLDGAVIPSLLFPLPNSCRRCNQCSNHLQCSKSIGPSCETSRLDRLRKRAFERNHYFASYVRLETAANIRAQNGSPGVLA